MPVSLQRLPHFIAMSCSALGLAAGLASCQVPVLDRTIEFRHVDEHNGLTTSHLTSVFTLIFPLVDAKQGASEFCGGKGPCFSPVDSSAILYDFGSIVALVRAMGLCALLSVFLLAASTALLTCQTWGPLKKNNTKLFRYAPVPFMYSAAAFALISFSTGYSIIPHMNESTVFLRDSGYLNPGPAHALGVAACILGATGGSCVLFQVMRDTSV